MTTKKTPLVIPGMAEIEINEDGLNIAYDGDIVLEQTMGTVLNKVEVSGNALLRLDKITGTVIAGKKLLITGSVDAEHLHGEEIHIGRRVFAEGRVRAKAITATRKISIDECTITADIIIAPEISIHHKCKGLVTIFEYDQKSDTPDIKGAFRLAEYRRLHRNLDEYITERNLQAYFKSYVGSKFLARARGEPLPEDPDDPELKDWTNPGKSMATDPGTPPSQYTEPPTNDSFSSDDVESENTEDSRFSESHDDVLVVIERDGSTWSPDEKLTQKLLMTCERLASVYSGDEVPDSVASVHRFVKTGDYQGLRSNINNLWDDYISWHKVKQFNPNHKATHAFTMIHGLVLP